MQEWVGTKKTREKNAMGGWGWGWGWGGGGGD